MAIPEANKIIKDTSWSSAHVSWLKDTGTKLSTADGKIVEVWEFSHQKDESILSSWAKHFRNHYCSDSDLDNLRKGYGYTRAEYLNKIKFPHATQGFGPGIRAGDFGEIMIMDYLEFILGMWVPRVRFSGKAIADESTKGCDTLGFLILKDGEESPEDVLAAYEVKARLSSDNLTQDKKLSGFQSAINDSAKDKVRISDSLNFMKQRFLDKGNSSDAVRIERFQNIDDHPYTEVYGAAALFSAEVFIPETISSAICMEHPKHLALRLVVIKGEQLMTLVHELYTRAADEA